MILLNHIFVLFCFLVPLHRTHADTPTQHLHTDQHLSIAISLLSSTGMLPSVPTHISHRILRYCTHYCPSFASSWFSTGIYRVARFLRSLVAGRVLYTSWSSSFVVVFHCTTYTRTLRMNIAIPCYILLSHFLSSLLYAIVPTCARDFDLFCL